MKKLGLYLGCFLLLSIVASAAPVACGDITMGRNLGAFIGPDAGYPGGCQDQDKLYSEFTYNRGGNRNPAASDVLWTIGTATFPGGVDKHTVTFSSPAGWVDPFEIGFRVQVTDPLKYIFSGALGTTATNLPFGPANASTVNETIRDYATDLTISAMSTVGNSNSNALIPRSTDIRVTLSGTPINGAIESVTATFFQATIPEPSTYMFLGTGLLALGFLRRKRA